MRSPDSSEASVITDRCYLIRSGDRPAHSVLIKRNLKCDLDTCRYRDFFPFFGCRTYKWSVFFLVLLHPWHSTINCWDATSQKTAEIMNHNNSQATKYYRVAKMICKKYDLHQFKVTTMDKLSSIRNHVPTPKILSSPSTTIMTNNDRQPHTVQPCTTSGIHTLVWEPQLYTESVLNRKLYLFYTLKKSFIYLYIYQ